jgi:hypothetical protein
VLGWGGQHAQVITGYVASGEDPAISTNFSVVGVYLSDPLRSDGMVNTWLTLAQLRSGNLRYRFQAYRMIDSPYDDRYTPGYRRSSIRSTTSEWYRRWVIIAPIRYDSAGSPPPPPPSPDPDTHADPHADTRPDAESDPDTDAHADSGFHADTDARAGGDADAGRDADAARDAHADSRGDSDPDPQWRLRPRRRPRRRAGRRRAPRRPAAARPGPAPGRSPAG